MRGLSPISVVLLATITPAQSGPCTEQISQLERQIANIVPGWHSGPTTPRSARAWQPRPQTGPTASQSIGAQLHHQPTPGSIQQADRDANKDADEAFDRAKKADTAGNATECNAALQRVRQLYELQ